nr:hypothetical protein [Candidatus Krumholzibacteria bacterium]
MLESRFRLFALTGLILVGLLLVSCEEDDPINCPTFDIGAIEGRILSAGEGTVAVIGARAMEPPRRGELLAVTQSAEDGSFSLAVPSGLYHLELDPSGGIVISSFSRDTVRVVSGIVAHDLLRGEAHISLTVPTALNGKSVDLRMEAGIWDQPIA